MSTGSILTILVYPQSGYLLAYHMGLSLFHCSYRCIGSLQRFFWYLRATKDLGLRYGPSRVRYWVGRSRFSLARTCPYKGPGGHFLGNPHPAPVRGPPVLISRTGPHLLPPICNWDLSGVWVGWGPEPGQGQGMPKVTPHPWPLSQAGSGKGPQAHVLRHPLLPVTNSRNKYHQWWVL